jgi:hypothetical protein
MRIAVLLALAACSDVEAQPSHAPNYADAVAAAQARMHERFKALTRIEQAIVASDLDRVHKEAALLISFDEPDVLARWKPFFEAVKDGARPLAEAGDPAAAAKLVAEVGRRCANCHEATKAKIPLETLAQPKTDEHLATQMMRHQWAAQRMWEGVIAPSTERWNEGARMLTEAPLTITAESSALGIENDVAKVHLLARRALDPKTDRPQLYGELLATCAHCHSVIRDR